MNWILFRILKQSTWIVTGVWHCRIRDLPVIKSSQKTNASTWIQTSASALGSKQTISSFKVFGRGETETIQGQIVFLFYFFTFSLLTWLNSCVSRKPIMQKHAFMQIFLGSFHIMDSLCHGCEDVPWTWVTLSTLSKIWKIRGRRGFNF